MAPFNETEDILQYLFPSPVGWSMPIASGQATPRNDLEGNSRMGDHPGDEAPDQIDETSPPALLQLNGMIRDAVSSRILLNLKSI